MQAGEHLLFGTLVLVGAVQALVRDMHPGLVVAVTAGLAGCYLIGVVWAHDRPPAVRRAWLVALTMLWVCAILVSSTFAWAAFALFFLYLYEFASVVALPAVAVLAAVVVATLLIRENGNPAATVIGPLLGAAVAIVIMMIYRDLIGENEERRRALEQLETAQSDLLATHDELATLQRATGVLQERERLGREIHDTLAQGLSSIVLTARAIRAGGAGSAAGATDPRVAQIEDIAQENLEEARRFVSALTPADLDRALLAEALERLVDRFREQTQVPARLQREGHAIALPTQYEAALLRVAQSALANVREHSRAGQVAVTLSFLPGEVTLDVVDDGVGFDPDVLLATPRGTSGFGLRGMRTRVSELGGRLTVETAPKEGTAVAASLPLPIRAPS